MTPAASTPCVIYARVSTREQGDSGLGLDAQEAACRQEAERRGWVIVKVFREALSGDKAARPLFSAACDLAHSHRGVLLAVKADRLSRAGVAPVLALHERAAREGWAVYALDMPEIDTTAPMGEFILTILAAVNRLERRMIAQRTKDALAVAKVRGTKSGRPIGRPRTLASETVERIELMRSGGLSLQRIADTLNAEGIPGGRGGTWTKQRVHKTIRRYAR